MCQKSAIRLLFTIMIAISLLKHTSFAQGNLFKRSITQKAGPANNSATNFYRRLTEAISDLETHAIVFFNGGVWQTKSQAAGGAVHWRIEDDTRADVHVQYVNHAPDSAEIKFNKPIHIWLPISGGVSFAITDLKYDQN